MVVDKDNYLLQVSRYIHLNPLSAKIVERPQDFRWSSYGSYLKGKGLGGLKTDTVLAYFSGSRSRQIHQYRNYVEGDREEKTRNPAPELIKQIFIGDEDLWLRHGGRRRDRTYITNVIHFSKSSARYAGSSGRTGRKSADPNGARRFSGAGRFSVTSPGAMGRWDSRNWLDFFKPRSCPPQVTP